MPEILNLINKPEPSLPTAAVPAPLRLLHDCEAMLVSGGQGEFSFN